MRMNLFKTKKIAILFFVISVISIVFIKCGAAPIVVDENFARQFSLKDDFIVSREQAVQFIEELTQKYNFNIHGQREHEDNPNCLEVAVKHDEDDPPSAFLLTEDYEAVIFLITSFSPKWSTIEIYCVSPDHYEEGLCPVVKTFMDEFKKEFELISY